MPDEASAQRQPAAPSQEAASIVKLAVVMHAMWVDGTFYCGDPATRAADRKAARQCLSDRSEGLALLGKSWIERMDSDVEIQAQDTTGNLRTYHITNTTNSQVVLAEMKSLKSQFPNFRVRAVDRMGD